MREIVEREPKDGGDGENFDDIGAACHWYNSNLREADIVHGDSIYARIGSRKQSVRLVRNGPHRLGTAMGAE